MKKTLSIIIFITGMLLLSNIACAGTPQINKDDTLQTILSAQKGKQVTVKLDSGDELTGKVGEVTDKLVVLKALSGKEFFDAFIKTTDIKAVLIRTKD